MLRNIQAKPQQQRQGFENSNCNGDRGGYFRSDATCPLHCPLVDELPHHCEYTSSLVELGGNGTGLGIPITDKVSPFWW